MYVAEASIRLRESADARLSVTDDFRLLAGDAGGGPGSHIGGDSIPQVLRLDHFDRRLAGRMRESMYQIEDCFAECGGDPGPRGTRARVADYLGPFRNLNFFEDDLGVLRQGRRW